MTRFRRDDGSAAIELVLVAPAVMMVFSIAVAAGRIYVDHNALDTAAQAGARQASISRDAVTADAQARAAVGASLSSDGLHCSGVPDVTVDTSGFSAPIGQPATVTVTVACTVPLSDLVVPGLPLPGTHSESASFTSVLDLYRSR
ncbi:pilus assembly protein [Catenulispora sp. NL8]|uniref:Pilus assembly protein n=1 Tax=Catenulispora pinistramenti TaxID=2705254 RepID=A0ABS5KHB6_9ACTN|nr:TadE family protein [Catenulispora pinistramenti]MBS2545370.1 pilus assembly protein [Catenulispora pinistramenti]